MLRGGSQTPFCVFWHRAGNSAAGIAAALAAARESAPDLGGRAIRPGVECDLKWVPDAAAPGGLHLYLYHGPTGLEVLSLDEARRRDAAGDGGTISLERALELAGGGLDWMVEVKRGHGDRRAALAACVEAFARRGLAGRLLLAASSLPVLEDLRGDHPDTPRLLFATHVTGGGRALHAPKLDVLRGLARGLLLGPGSLAGVDALSALGPFGRGRPGPPGGPARVPRTTSVAETVAFARAGLAGAFAYFGPEPLRDQ